jgi:hypothetical protein
MSQDDVGCKECKRLREHVASLLPFKVLEAVTGKPLSIRGVAMCSGMSRNHNIYTAEELEAFTDKLANAPVYIEHVAVPNAIGKVQKPIGMVTTSGMKRKSTTRQPLRKSAKA